MIFDERLEQLLGRREDWLTATALVALGLPVLHPLVRSTIGVGSHLLWFIYVFPSAIVAYRYGRAGAIVFLLLSPAFVLAGERTFGAGYGTPASWETAISLSMSLAFTNVLVVGFALSARQRRDELAHSAETDVLTGLPNRRRLRSRLEGELHRFATETGYGFALAYIDLDRFARVNDSLGHTLGDDVLEATAARLRASVRSRDMVARIGGDEFLVLFAGIRSEDSALRATRNLLDTIRDDPIRTDGHSVVLTASAGVALVRDGHDGPDEIVRDADAALVAAEERGPHSVAFFESDMHSRAHRRLHLENELRDAVAADQLELHYQPLVRAADQSLRGAEALLRWRHPERGLISPGEFLPIVETSDLLEPVGLWVLEEATDQARRWSERFPGRTPLVMSVNVSARQLNQPSFLEAASDRAGEIRNAGAVLELELTEEALMEDARGARSSLERLRSQGARFAVDDFGTGYSSLRYLHELPVDTVKIDRSFVTYSEGPSERPAIARTVVTLADALDMEVVAEGVETEPVRETMIRIGCDTLQGYWYGQPLPPVGFESRYRTDLASRTRSLASVTGVSEAG